MSNRVSKMLSLRIVLLWVMFLSALYAEAEGGLNEEELLAFSKGATKQPYQEELPQSIRKKGAASKDTYTINFNNVSIIEYIRFVGKISGANFIFDENDLQFVITLTSEEPATLENVFSALVQILRVHNLFLLEQEGNFLITANSAVNQIPTIIAADQADGELRSPVSLVTRVFRIHNMSANSIATIIRSMISNVAQVAVSNETNQLIVTDIVTNVDKISQLLTTLDTPHTPLDVESYIAKAVPPKELAVLATLILQPFTEGNPLVFVPQVETNSLFIVSTPYLLERSLAVLIDLDIAGKAQPLGTLTAENVFFYRPETRSRKEVLAGIQQVLVNLQQTSTPPEQLVRMLESGKYVEENQSILFTGDAATFQKVQEILSNIDASSVPATPHYYIYQVRHTPPALLQRTLKDFVKSLESEVGDNTELTKAIETGKYLNENNSLVFSGSPATLAHLRELLPTLDQPPTSTGSQFLLYALKHDNRKKLESSLDVFAETLKKSSTPDAPLVDVLRSVQYLPDSNALIFTGDRGALDRLNSILPTLDLASSELLPKTSFYIYPIKNISEKQLHEYLKQLADTVKSGKIESGLYEAIESVKYLKDSHAVIFTGPQNTLDRLQQLLLNIDTEKLPANRFFIYQLSKLSFSQFDLQLQALAKKLDPSVPLDQELVSMIKSAQYMKDTNSVLFSGTENATHRLQQILPSLDTASSEKLAKSGYYLYAPQHGSSEDFEKALAQFTQNLSNASHPDENLIETLRTGKYLKETNSFAFNGTPETITRLQQLLPTLDVVPPTAQSAYIVYRLQNAKQENLEASLKQFVRNMNEASHPDHDLIQAIQSMRFIKETNSMVFTGDQAALSRLQQLLSSFDVPWAGTAPAGLPASDKFYIYTPRYLEGADLMKMLKDMEANLKDSGLADPALLRAISTVKWIPSSNTFVITGDAHSIDALQKLLATIDTESGAPPSTQILLYHPQHISQGRLEEALRNLARKLSTDNPTEKELANVIDGMHWIKTSESFAFKGSPAVLDKLKSLLVGLDVSTREQKIYIVYKLQYAPADAAKAYLDTIASGMASSDVNGGIAETIRHIKSVKENNSLLITGTKDAVEAVKQLIANYDIPASAPPVALQEKITFALYKPKNLSPAETLDTLKGLAAELSVAGGLRPAVKKGIESIRIVDATKSLAITGSEETIRLIQQLLEEVDVPNTQIKQIHQIGSKTFFIYKLRHASPTQFMASLQSMSRDLLKGGVEDKELGSMIHSMKWIKETNSILFTGTEQSFHKLQAIIDNFDVPALAEKVIPPPEAPPVSNYSVYRPIHRSGDELIEQVQEFAHNLRQSGLHNASLYDAVNNLQWMESTCSVIITGDEVAIGKIQDLLHQFDRPTGDPNAITTQEIGESSFLIFKLQYQQGSDIRKALVNLSESLKRSPAAQKTGLIDAVENVQWIPATNSLLASGSPAVLDKLRGLVMNLDVPLRQVFIEVLAITTDVTNNQSFGLSWGGNLQYLNRTAAQIGNWSTATDSAGTTQANPLATALAPIFPIGSSPTYPRTTGLPTNNSGFDLGVIGDIIFHKGQAFLSLGSLVNALQTDSDSEIVLNPKIVAQDSNPATLFFGQNIPFIGSTISINGASSSSTTNLEYRNVGHSLTIVPTLGTGDLITLDITENISSVSSQNLQFSQGLGITTNQSNMQTRVHVPDGHFVCLMGQIQETRSHVRTQIPCLGGLPVIGAAFANNNRTQNRSNLIIFMRPQIIKTQDDYHIITQHQEDLHRDRAGLLIMKEEFDEALDLVKVPEDE